MRTINVFAYDQLPILCTLYERLVDSNRVRCIDIFMNHNQYSVIYKVFPMSFILSNINICIFHIALFEGSFTSIFAGRGRYGILGG